MSSFPVSIRSLKFFLPTILVLINTVCALAQSSVVSESAPTVDPVHARIERARALAAAHQLQTAAVELENVRASSERCGDSQRQHADVDEHLSGRW